MNTLHIFTILCIGSLIGVEFAVSAFINPILGKLDEAAHSAATRLFARTLGTVMPFWYIACLLLLIAETIARMYQGGFLQLLLATIAWVVAILMSILFLVPINNRIVRSDAGPFNETTRRESRQWDSLHKLRVAVLVLAMVIFLIGIQI